VVFFGIPDKAYLPQRMPSILRILGAFGVFAVVAALLFRDHLLKYRVFLGNPDRLNSNLKVLRAYVENVESRSLSAWNETEMLGYDMLALPYTFPNPITLLISAFGPDQLLFVSGIASAVLLAGSGFTAYLFARSINVSHKLSVLAGILYQCSALSILKVSQNDMSFMVFLLLPLLAIVIERAHPRNLSETFLSLATLVFMLVQFCFLQKVAYTLLFIGAYAIFKAQNFRSWQMLVSFASALFVGVLGALPRIEGLLEAMHEYVRIQPGVSMETFNKLFTYQGIFAHQGLRWFEDGIMGRYFSDPIAKVNGINLTEGFLLYTTPMIPFIVIWGFIRFDRRWQGQLLGQINLERFFAWTIVATFLIALWKPANYMMHLVFGSVDFVHARVLIIGLLPLVCYAVLQLQFIRPKIVTATDWQFILPVIIVTVIMTSLIEIIPTYVDGSLKFYFLHISMSALVHSILSALVLLVLMLRIRYLCHKKSASVLFQSLCLIIGFQAVLGADFRLNGSHTRLDKVPFESGDLYFARRDDFRNPTREERISLHTRLERERYRSVVLCDPRLAGGFCAGHVAQFWNLRLADGYYGIGVPERLAMLPWTTGLGLRQIRFTSSDEIPWALLGFLNVRYAIIGDDRLYRNNQISNTSEWPQLMINPSIVTPRVFFAESAIPARSPQHAREILFGDGHFPDPVQGSVIEGIQSDQTYSTSGLIQLFTSGDNVSILVEPSPKERLLVLNELINPRWTAMADGVPVNLLPANLVMRAVVVPPHAKNITMQYIPTVSLQRNVAVQCIAALLLIMGFIVFRRWK